MVAEELQLGVARSDARVFVTYQYSFPTERIAGQPIILWVVVKKCGQDTFPGYLNFDGSAQWSLLRSETIIILDSTL